MTITTEKSDKTHLIVHCKKGDVLMTESDLGGGVYLLKEGQLGIYKTKAGEKIKIAEVGPGTMVGEMHLIDGKPRSASVVALTDCMLYQIPEDKFKSTLEAQPEWYKTLVRTLVDRIRKTTERQIE